MNSPGQDPSQRPWPFGAGNAPMGGHLKSIVGGIVILIIVGIALIRSVATVPTGHIGVVTQFGKITNELLDEGFHVINPLNSVTQLDLRVINVTQTAECFSRDLQLVKVHYSLLLRLPKDKAITVLHDVGPLYTQHFVIPILDEVLKQNTAQFNAEDLVAKRDDIRVLTQKALQPRIGKIVEVQDIIIRNIDFSPEYAKSIEEKQVAQQSALKAGNQLKQARVDAETKIAKADGEAKAIQIQGQALANNPAIVQWEAIKRWDGKAPSTVLLDEHSKLSVIFPIQ